MTIAAFLMAFFGFIELVRRGETSRNVMESTVRFPAGFTVGEKQSCGSRFGQG
jgi:hypothetical protein